jgi:hypothetical protein
MKVWKWVVVYIKGKKISYKGFYKISNFGQVKSVERYRKGPKGPQIVKKKILKQIISSMGYPVVNLSKHSKTHRFEIHLLVLGAFVGRCPEGLEARHLDDNKLNNYLENLRWGTHKQNCEDKVKNGNSTRGEKNARSVLTESQVRKIRKLSPRFTKSQLGKRFRVSWHTIRNIVDRKQWGWLE